jgi:hypothetical protein
MRKMPYIQLLSDTTYEVMTMTDPLDDDSIDYVIEEFPAGVRFDVEIMEHDTSAADIVFPDGSIVFGVPLTDFVVLNPDGT